MIPIRASFIHTFFLLLLIDVLQAQQNKIFDCRTKDDDSSEFTCKIAKDCPAAKTVISKGIAKICGYEKTNGKTAVQICCPSPRKKKMQNPIAVANNMCKKYREAIYVYKQIQDPLSSDSLSTTIKEKDCSFTSVLITNGTRARVKEFPHMALIGYGDESSINWRCGGTLISEKYVLSAAHCTHEGSEPRWVRLGELNYEEIYDDQEKPITVAIAAITVHPNYKHPSIYNDIALFKLQSAVKLTPYIRPICLYTSPTLPKKEPIVTGWGTTGTGEQLSSHLLKATISFATYAECAPFYEQDTSGFPRGVDSNTMICAVDRENGKDSCSGDSGGPLQFQVADDSCIWHQIGIVSTGSKFCGDKETPAIYTKVSNYIAWIQVNVWP